MKIKVSLSQKGYRNGELEIDVGDQPTREDAVNAAYILAEQVSFRDPRIKWGEWGHAFRENPDPDDITIIAP